VPTIDRTLDEFRRQAAFNRQIARSEASAPGSIRKAVRTFSRAALAMKSLRV
jgi:hypothetical protein